MLMASGPPMLMPMVAPSGAALATASVPMIAAGARLVLDHEGAVRIFLAELVGDHAGDDVGRRAGAERHHDAHGLAAASPCAAAGAAGARSSENTTTKRLRYAAGEGVAVALWRTGLHCSPLSSTAAPATSAM